MKTVRYLVIFFSILILILTGSVNALATGPARVQGIGDGWLTDGSYLASPDDLRALGLENSFVTAQEEALAELSESELNRLQEHWNKIGPVNPNQVKSSTDSEAESEKLVARTRLLPCAWSNDYYRTRDKAGNQKCFADSRSYSVNYLGMWPAFSLRAGNNKGRVLYNPYGSNGQPLWWSVYRGANDYNWYFFNQEVQVKTVNIA